MQVSLYDAVLNPHRLMTKLHGQQKMGIWAVLGPLSMVWYRSRSTSVESDTIVC